ncbi:DUF5105 domain-containing protein [Enterococcus sp. LJL98]
MHKKWIGMVLPAFTLLLLAGCTKAIPAEEAAPLLLDEMIYEKKAEAFQTNFLQSEELETAFQSQRTSFEENFTEGLLQSGEAVDQQVAAEISEALMKQVKEQTSYNVKQITETKSIFHVIYEVKGFDLMALFKASTTGLLEKIEEKNNLVKDPEKLVTETVKIMQDQIPLTPAKETSTEVTLQLKQNKGKWEIVGGQDETLASLYLAFYAGVRDEEELAAEMMQAMSEVIVPNLEEIKEK